MKLRSLAFFTALAPAAAVSVLSACSDDPELPEVAAPTPAPEASTAEASVDGPEDARPSYDGADVPVICDAAPCAVRVVAGDAHYCALIDDGTVRCWGRPDVLGGGLDADVEPGAPRTVDGVSGVVDLVARGNRTCAVLADGGADCWGENEPTATRLADVEDVERVVLGGEMSCAVVKTGALRCWGDSYVFGSEMREIDLGGRAGRTGAIASAAAFVLDSEGVLRSWGADRMLLGRETSIAIDRIARPVNVIPKVAGVASSAAHACAITTDGRLFCWGTAGNAMLGLGYVRDESNPVAVAFPDRMWPQQVTASDTHSCVRMTTGAVYCWGGLDPWGELGQPRRGGVYVPTKIERLAEDIVSVSVGLSSSCALNKSGVVWCWGVNTRGQLGRGQRDDDRHPLPAPVVFP